MTRQFHARVRLVPRPEPRAAGPHTLSFTCFRLVPIDEPGQPPFDVVELCDPRNAMRALLVRR
jgi:hypothetical protein